MSRLQYVKDIRPSEISIERLYTAVTGRLSALPHYVSWHADIGGLRSRNEVKLLNYKGKHEGEEVIIIANGPSLKKVDFSLLDGRITIGMNRIYKKFLPSYLVVMDKKIQIEQFAPDLDRISSPVFFNWFARDLFSGTQNQCFLLPTYRPRFSKDLMRGIWGGHSVTYACLQLAYFMGFHKVILIGKDHSYVGLGKPGDTVISDGEGSNHFMKGYYQKGMKWKLPDYKGEELAYEMADAAFKRDGRKVIDATADGKLMVFEKMSLTDALSQ